MNGLRPGVAILLCAAWAAVAWAGEPSVLKSASDAVTTAVDSAAKVAKTASKAAADAITPEPPKSTKKKKSAAKSGRSREPDAVTPTDQPSKTETKDIVPKGKTEAAKATAADKPAGTSAKEPASSSKPTQEAKPAAAPAPAKTATPESKPDAQPKDAKGAPAAWPKTLPDAKAEAEAKAAAAKLPIEWTSAEIDLAKARCTAILKGVNAVTIPEKPFREGATCGAAAPVRLVSVGKSPEVSFSPPALVTCDMVAALDKWVTGDLQPLAKKTLGQNIIKIEVMSDYACRAAYGRSGNKLSEHAYANALDIRGFVTATGQMAYVLEGWGETHREAEARIAAAKAATEKAEADRVAAENNAQTNLRNPKAPAAADDKTAIPPAAVATKSGAPAGGIAKTTIIDGVPRLTVTLPGAQPAADTSAAKPSLSLGVTPSHLGGPKRPPNSASSGDLVVRAASKEKPSTPAAPAQKSALNASVSGTKTSFLHQAHAAACRIFGTTLGPEANDAHRNHFHVDMAERQSTKICD